MFVPDTVTAQMTKVHFAMCRAHSLHKNVSKPVKSGLGRRRRGKAFCLRMWTLIVVVMYRAFQFAGSSSICAICRNSRKIAGVWSPSDDVRFHQNKLTAAATAFSISLDAAVHPTLPHVTTVFPAAQEGCCSTICLALTH